MTQPHDTQELAGYRQQLFSTRDELAICRDERDRYRKVLVLAEQTIELFGTISDPTGQGRKVWKSHGQPTLDSIQAALTQDKEQER